MRNKKPGERAITGINTEDCGRSCQGGSPGKFIVSTRRHVKWLDGLPRTDDHLHDKFVSQWAVDEWRADSLKGQQTEILVAFCVSNGGKRRLWKPPRFTTIECLGNWLVPKDKVPSRKIVRVIVANPAFWAERCGASGAPS